MKINGTTKLIALIGDPIKKAKTPEMLNQLLDEKGKLGEYLTIGFHVRSEHLSETIQGLKNIKNFVGAVVTMPHKKEIIKLLDEIDPVIRIIGAANVFTVTSTGKLQGYNFDGIGFINGLNDANIPIKNSHIVVIGTGGAAAAISYELLKHQCQTLSIMSRSLHKAEDLKQQLLIQFPQALIYLNETHQKIDLLINATPLGMSEQDPLPISEDIIKKSKVVAECVVSIEETNFLKIAKKHCQIHTGKAMLNGQISSILDLFLK